MSTHDEEPGIMVRKPDSAIYYAPYSLSVQTRAFYLMWEAGLRHKNHPYHSASDITTLDPLLAVHADFFGRTLLFARMLNGHPFLVVPSSCFKLEEIARSVQELNQLLCNTWLPNLYPIPGMNEEKWSTFFAIVQALQEENNPDNQIDAFAEQTSLSFQAVRVRASYYTREMSQNGSVGSPASAITSPCRGSRRTVYQAPPPRLGVRLLQICNVE